jgi:hypothetical protein
MSDAKLKLKAAVGTMALAVLVATCPGGWGAFAEERPKASSAVKVLVQGGGGVEPVPGAPPPVEPSLESRPAPATLGPVPPSARAHAADSSLRAISTAEGEATIEIDGVREVVRPGSRLGRDTVKAVGPGRLVLQRAAAAEEPASLVIVTFDEGGRAKTRVFWTTDPAAPKASEVKRP